MIVDRSAGTTGPGWGATSLVRAYTPTLEANGWDPGCSVVEVVTDDMPFLVDSVTMELDRQKFGIQLLIHPGNAGAARPDRQLLGDVHVTLLVVAADKGTATFSDVANEVSKENGMLLSERIRLVAAFDHRHIFVDPDPVPVGTRSSRSGSP